MDINLPTHSQSSLQYTPSTTSTHRPSLTDASPTRLAAGTAGGSVELSVIPHFGTSAEVSYGHFGTKENTSAPGNTGPSHSKAEGKTTESVHCAITGFVCACVTGLHLFITSTVPIRKIYQADFCACVIT